MQLWEVNKMDAQSFWNVIGDYNQQTLIIQIGLLLFLVLSMALSYTQKIKWFSKFALGIDTTFKHCII